MTIRFLTIFFCILLSVKTYSQELWTLGTAIPLKQKKFEIALFDYSRYGITNNLELNSQLTSFAILPNLGIKKMWYHRKYSKDAKIWKKSIFISTNHGFNFPTFTLRIARNRQLLKLIDKTAEIPGILAFKNEFLVSSFLKSRTSCELPNYLLTLKLGTKIAFNTGENTMKPIEKPILFRETSIYQKKLLWYVGADLDANFRQYFNYNLDLDFYSVGLGVKYWSVEHKGLIYDDITPRWRIALGYKSGVCTMPAKLKFFIYPLFDIVYCFNQPKGKQMNLFEDEVFKANDDRSSYITEKPKKKKKDKEQTITNTNK